MLVITGTIIITGSIETVVVAVVVVVVMVVIVVFLLVLWSEKTGLLLRIGINSVTRSTVP